jgi:hypothetical protein
MAAQISHMLAGEEALGKVLSVPDPKAIGEAIPFFRFGCQGPDIFYHNQRTKPSGLHYGALAHRRRFGSLVAGAAAALSSPLRGPESPAGAYLLGLATHASVDRATHPFIICFAGWADPSDPSTRKRRGCHPFLERLLDMGLLERRLGLSPAEYGLSARMGIGAPPIAGSEEAIVALWAAGLRAAYPRATGADPLLEARIANALADARRFYAVTDPAAAAHVGREEVLATFNSAEGRHLISLIYPERLPEGMDAMNESRLPWPHPSGDGRVSSASYLELIDEGVAGAARAIGLVLGFWKGELSEAALAEGLGEGGLALCDAGGDALPPRICRPLALPEAMDAEYAARVDVSGLSRYDAPHEHEG